MIDLKQLMALRAIRDSGSGVRAAQALEWSHSTLDYHVNTLERVVGAQLVTRSSRGTRLTDAGTMLCERGEQILDAVERLSEDMRDYLGAGSIRVRLGVFPSAAANLLPQIVQISERVGLRLEIILDEVGPLAARLASGEIDAALLYTLPGYDFTEDRRLVMSPLFREDLQLAVSTSHQVSASESIDRERLLDLASERWIGGLAEGDPIESALHNIFAESGKSVSGPVRTDDFSVIFGLVAASAGIAVVPAILPETMPAQVARVPLSSPDFEVTVHFASQRENRSKQYAAAMRQLGRAVQEAISETLDNVAGVRLSPRRRRPTTSRAD